MTLNIISKELLDELPSSVDRQEDLLSDKGLMTELKVRMMEDLLSAELAENLDYKPHGDLPANRSTGVMGRGAKC